MKLTRGQKVKVDHHMKGDIKHVHSEKFAQSVIKQGMEEFTYKKDACKAMRGVLATMHTLIAQQAGDQCNLLEIYKNSKYYDSILTISIIDPRDFNYAMVSYLNKGDEWEGLLKDREVKYKHLDWRVEEKLKQEYVIEEPDV